MKDKFPEIYKSRVEKLKTNVQRDFYYRANNEQQIGDITREIPKPDLLKRINDIFLRPDFVYQADINIMFKNGNNINKKIVGIKDNYLITFDGEKINIDDIYDIK